METENVKLKQNQIIPGKNGGARPGAGRPKGVGNKLKIGDYFTPAEIDQVVMEAKLLAFGDGNTKPDKDMLKFIIDQLFGKATQRQVQEDGDGNALVPLMVKFIENGNNNTNRV